MKKMISVIKTNGRNADWNLLVFLMLFVHVKLAVKLLALVFIYVRRPLLRFRFSLRPPGISRFYLLVIVISLVNVFIYSLAGVPHYWFLLLAGSLFWIICILVSRQVLWQVFSAPDNKTHAAVFLFFLLNALVSGADIVRIMVDAGELNPYRYQGNYQQYFIGTGDYIRGLSFDTSTTNAILNAAGIIYFLFQRKYIMSLVCMAVMLLTCSNFTNLLLLVCLCFMFLFRSDSTQKSVIVVMVCMLIAFMTNISPQNNQYALRAVSKIIGREKRGTPQEKPVDIRLQPDSILDQSQRRQKIAQLYLDSMMRLHASPGSRTVQQAIELPRVNIHAPEYQHRPDSSAARKQAIGLYQQIKPVLADTMPDSRRYAGKVVAWMQLWRFFMEHPAKLATGNGMGRFSSKIAFRATGLHVAGGYPSSFIYIDPAFRDNHLLVYLDYFAKDNGFHSISNTPNSVYGQLLGEYGILGFVCFVVFYLVYFIRGRSLRGYGAPMLVLLCGAFFSDYWFEQLSVVVVLELLLLLNIKQQTNASHV